MPVILPAFVLALAPTPAVAQEACVQDLTDTGVQFNYSGVQQSCTVPTGVTHIHAVVVGGSGFGEERAVGGRGAKVTADLPVTAGETLYVLVGGDASGAAGGFNGGGEGGPAGGGGSGGGGASDIRTVSSAAGGSLASRLIVAGGGGGGAWWHEGFQPAKPLNGGDAGLVGHTAGAGEFSSLEEFGGPGLGGGELSGGLGGAGKCVAGAAGEAGSGGGAARPAGGGGGGWYGGGGGGNTESNQKGFYECHQGSPFEVYAGAGGGGSSHVAGAANVTSELEPARPAHTEVELTAPLPILNGESRPQISGEAVPGKALAATAATWAGNPTHFSDAWLRCDAKEQSCAAIPGATSTTYTVTPADGGYRIAFTETAENFFGSSVPTGTLGSGHSPLVGSAPAARTGAATEVGITVATLTGTVEPSWLASTVFFQYGPTPSYGQTTAPLPIAAGGSPVPVSAALAGLAPGTTYDYSLVAENALGPVAGVNLTFTTAPLPPPAPADTALPAVSGSPLRGDALLATNGSWSHSPTAFAYQWQRCDAAGAGCASIPGATGAEYTLTDADVGHTLRVAVTASNTTGAAAATSAPSPVIGSQIEATMAWRFGWTRKYTIVQRLRVTGVPAGAAVEVACHGGGCPFAHARPAAAAHGRCKGRRCAKPHAHTAGEVNLTSMFAGRRLRPGTHFTVELVKPGWVGKAFLFTTRSGATPATAVTCLAPGSTRPGAGC